MPVATDPIELVPRTYRDASRRWVTVSPAARSAALAAIGAPAAVDPVAIVRPGARLPVRGEVSLEDGTDLGRLEALPRDVPHGYHRLAGDDGVVRALLSGPGACHLPPDLHAWGWVVQLPTTRSRSSWGSGDLRDLRQLGEWAASIGAGFVVTGPLVAPQPGPDPDPSPYFPSTRRWLDPIHLCIPEVPGADPSDPAVREALALDDDPIVDRRRVLALKAEALDRAWRRGAFDRPAFDAWRAAQGDDLERWAAYCLAAASHGADWRRWPEPMRSPRGTALRPFMHGDPERAAFHGWVQWCLAGQLERAAAPVGRVADMPVGFDPGGFDAWDWQEHLAPGMSIGVPPDRFNAAGQDWGMPAFGPNRLRAVGFAPFIETIRAQLRSASGLRIDHVLGLFRQWWVPGSGDPRGGAYVRQPTAELLEIVAIESVRAGAIVIGEDLGTVPTGVRPELRRRRILSTRLAYFERVPPARYPRLSVAGVTTHDLPTLGGTWTGADLIDQRAAGVSEDSLGLGLLRARLAAAAGVGKDASLEEVTLGIHRALGRSPAALVTVNLTDALGVMRRPNIPGTALAQRPNWSMALPVPVEELAEDPGVESTVTAVDRR